MKPQAHISAKEERETRDAAGKWLEGQRGRPQYRAAPHARNAVAKIMRPLAKKHGAGSTGLASHWDAIVGFRFAKISRPVKFASGREGRTLVIAAPGPAAALIMASSNKIIERANGFLGAGHIRHIKIIQTKLRTETSRRPAPQGLTQQAGDQLQSGLESVGDAALKDALESLGRKVLSRGPQ